MTLTTLDGGTELYLGPWVSPRDTTHTRHQPQRAKCVLSVCRRGRGGRRSQKGEGRVGEKEGSHRTTSATISLTRFLPLSDYDERPSPTTPWGHPMGIQDLFKPPFKTQGKQAHPFFILLVIVPRTGRTTTVLDDCSSAGRGRQCQSQDSDRDLGLLGTSLDLVYDQRRSGETGRTPTDRHLLTLSSVFCPPRPSKDYPTDLPLDSHRFHRLPSSPTVPRND